MNCKEIQKIILENRIDEIPDSLRQEINDHVALCGDCFPIAIKLKKIEELTLDLKKAEPVFNDEEAVTQAILKEIRNKNKSLLKKLFDKIFVPVQIPAFRLALTSIVLFLFSLYLYQEYDAVVKISALEKNNNQISADKYYSAGTLSQTAGSAALLYNFYKFFVTGTDHVNVSEDVILIRKSQLADLFKDFNKLDDEQKKNILQLKKELFPEEDSSFTKELRIDKEKILKKIDLLKAK